MRLCFIADGNSVFTERWLNPLVAQGHDVALLSYTRIEHPPAGAAILDLSAVTDVRKARFALWSLAVRRFVRRWQPDLLHAHQLAAAGWLGAASAVHPFVASAWGSDLLVEPHHRSWLRRALLRAVLGRCDALTVPSSLLAAAARDLGVDDGVLVEIPWGVEEDIFVADIADRARTRERLGLSLDAFVVIAPRRIAPLYNPDVIARAFAVAFERTDAHLVLLAAGADPGADAHLREQIRTLGIAARTHWLPERYELRGMAALYRAADVTVSLPSSEGYGASVREAMACGCPTVISDLPVFASLFTDGVHTVKVPVGDAIATAAALRRLACDGEVRERLRRAGREVSRRQTAAARTVRVEQLYRRLVATGRP